MVAPFLLTASQQADIVRRYEQGETVAGLARRFGCSFRPIKRLLDQRGIYDGQRVRAGAKYTPDEKRRIIAEYEAGASIYTLAERYNFSANGLWKFLRANGVKLRFHGKIEGRRGTHGKYLRVQVDPSDPLAVAMGWKNGFVLEHRLVMARSLGRPLDPHETVHHINGDTHDNRLANLQMRTGRHGKGVALACLECGSHNVGPVPLAE